MKKIVIKKGDRIVIGKISDIYLILEVNPETIRRWVRQGLSIKKNGWDVYTDAEFI